MCFRCLDRLAGTLQYRPQQAAAFFVACCVLHNMAMNHGCVHDINEDRLEDLHVPLPLNLNAPAAARERRAHITES